MAAATERSQRGARGFSPGANARLISGGLKSEFLSLILCLITLGPPALATDAQQAQVQNLDELREALLKTPVTPQNQERRRALLECLDTFLRRPDSERSEPVVRHYQTMIDHALDEISAERVEAGVTVWKFYSSSLVIKTPKTVFGIDLDERPGGPGPTRGGESSKVAALENSPFRMTAQQRGRLASLVNISFHTHRHHDHIDYTITEELLKVGKTVVVPQDIRTMWTDTPIASKLTVLEGAAGSKRPVGDLKVEVLLSQQWMSADHRSGSCPCNAYLITTDNGINVLVKGDINDGNDLMPWLQQIKARREVIDLYVSSHFFWPGQDAQPQIESLFDPFIIPGHEYEFTHRKPGQWGSGTGSYKLLFERCRTAIERGRCVILSWGEKYHYFPATQTHHQ
jgi:L-ascorbate metabolism protein UlaG (beta-lactamase superfamily)